MWRRLNPIEKNLRPPKTVSFGWRLNVAPNAIECAGVDHFLLLIDDKFPNSQPLILAPQANQNYAWPHVEPGGFLCLQSTLTNKDPGQRLLQHIKWAQELLCFSENTRRLEFEREFSTYWTRCKKTDVSFDEVLSLLTPRNQSREIVTFNDVKRKRLIIADDQTSLINWAKHRGENTPENQFSTTWLQSIDKPWIPAEFPQHGSDVINQIPNNTLEGLLRPAQHKPIVFEVNTVNGVVFVVIVIKSNPPEIIAKGFRNISNVPKKHTLLHFSAPRVSRYPVTRVDGSWVHGRDKDHIYSVTSKANVAVIGCGSLGSVTARMLAQAGVGEFTLIDNDTLEPHNTSRHALGNSCLGTNKAEATALMLKQDFPHIVAAEHIRERFEDLNPEQLKALEKCDVIFSAGIDYEGDLQIDHWRRQLKKPLIHICAWTEAFAIAGHAVALFDQDTLMDAFDDEERVIFRLSDWPSGALIAEAGCGDFFQPHGAVELQTTVTTAAGLVLDVISGKVDASLRRVWQGNREEVKRRGGIPCEEFVESFCMKEISWC